MGVCLLIFEKNSTQHVLIPYHTFNNFGKLFQSSLKNEQKPQFFIVSIENVHIIFPPYTIIPYHTIIYLDSIFHPICLFHTVQLLDSLEYSVSVEIQ